MAARPLKYFHHLDTFSFEEADWKNTKDEGCSAMFNESSVSGASLVIQGGSGHAYRSQHETPNDWQK